MTPAPVPPVASFVVGEWLVEPDLSQVSRAGHAEHVRPQLIDLLVYLARNTGRTVPQTELLAHVWPGQPFVTETALPRCIAELRRTFGDRASGPTMIQTVPKRGYRLIAAVVPAADGWPATRPVAGAAAVPQSQPRPEPTGQPDRTFLATLSTASATAASTTPSTLTHSSAATAPSNPARSTHSTVAQIPASVAPCGGESDSDRRHEKPQPTGWLPRACQAAARAWRLFRRRTD